ncbi:MAG TPA: TlpA disulfide reductase family protein, partial [Burkholderiaceae bacterium]|nr:TlpA disulfide reductase family protein [Burkholderiaceae bacterium]
MSRKHMRWAAVIASLALVAGFSLALRFFSTAATDTSADAFFDRTFNDLDGQPMEMSRWKGRIVVVNFWATWCPPCVEEMPDLQRVHNEYADRGVTILGLGIDSPSALKRFRDEHRLSLPLYAAGSVGSELGRALGNPSGALPYTVLV